MPFFPLHRRRAIKLGRRTQWHAPCILLERTSTNETGRSMSLGTILIIVLILMLLGVLPTWPHSRQWGYAPSGIVGTVVLILVVLFLLGRL